MNKQNLKNFKDLSEKERKEISSKGGKASAKKRREAKEIKAKYNDLMTTLLDSRANIGQNFENGNNLGILNILKGAENIDRLEMNGFDLIIARGLEIIFCTDSNLQNERIKATRLLYDIKHDLDLAQERKEEREIRKELALKELDLKERALLLEERRTKAKEELIKMKNREAIDILESKDPNKLKKALIESIVDK